MQPAFSSIEHGSRAAVTSSERSACSSRKLSHKSEVVDGCNVPSTRDSIASRRGSKAEVLRNEESADGKLSPKVMTRISNSCYSPASLRALHVYEKLDDSWPSAKETVVVPRKLPSVIIVALLLTVV